MTRQTRFSADVAAEREAQREQWGGRAHDERHTWQEWLSILAVRFGKLGTALLVPSGIVGPPWLAAGERQALIRRRLIQIAAVASAAAEAMEDQ